MTTNNEKEKENPFNSLCSLYKSCGLPLKSTCYKVKELTIKEEICYYISTVHDNITFSQYWANNKNRLPILSYVARRYNVICAMSISSESAFSASDFVQRKHRTSLAFETLRCSMILRK